MVFACIDTGLWVHWNGVCFVLKKWCLLAFATLFASSCWNWQLKLFTVAVQDFCLEYKARNFTEAADILIFGIQGQNTLYPQFGRQTNTLEPNLFESSCCMLAESTLMYSLTPFIDIIFYCLVEEEHQMSKLSFSPCNCKGSGGMAWRFGACQIFLGSHLKFTGVNVKRPRQHACSHLSSDALIVSCFWCLVFLLYYTPWVSEKQPILAEQAVHQSPWFSWICSSIFANFSLFSMFFL